ncbi:MAG TPA: DUF4157 domain-containing protein [Verrucomicrobiae bacterium]
MKSRAILTANTPESRHCSCSKPKTNTFSPLLHAPRDFSLPLHRKLGNQELQRQLKSGRIQAKLQIGAPNDLYEQEADLVAEQVMRGSASIQDMSDKNDTVRAEQQHSESLVTSNRSNVQDMWIQPQRKASTMQEHLVPVPQWEHLPLLAQKELGNKGYDKSWFDARRNNHSTRLTVLNLYVKLRGIQGHNLWDYVGTEVDSQTGVLQFKSSKVHDLKTLLKSRADFTSPEDSPDEWSSREMRASGSLHFKHFKNWPEEKVQAHIDQAGLLLKNKAWWLVPVVPLGQMARHAIEYLGYDDFTDVYGIRDILVRQGYWAAPLVGVGETVQRKASHVSGAPSSEPFQNVDALDGQGEPLPTSARAFYESRFGRDFSQVRLHTNEAAARQARQLNAAAFTLGRNIVFGTGQYAPETIPGRTLLAHELAHVVQQTEATCHCCNQDNTLHFRCMGSHLVQRMPQSEEQQPQPQASKAASHAEAMLKQSSPRIWFDDWCRDKRDNNDNGMYDEEDPQELRYCCPTCDGQHYNAGKVFPSAARIKPRLFGSAEIVPPHSIMYKVCADIVNESYRSAGITLSRSVATLEAIGRKKPFRAWRQDRQQEYPKLLPGDIITYKTDGHSHSGIVGTSGSIIHLPGPSNWLYFNRYSKNDMESTWPTTWRLFFGISQVSRLSSDAGPKKHGT